MDPVVVHYVRESGRTVELIDELIRESGGVPLRTWSFGEHDYTVIAEPTSAVIEVLAGEVDLLAAARLEIAGEPSPAQIGDLLPESLPRRIEFPPQARSEVRAALDPEGAPLVHCHCELGLHEAPLCAAAGESSAPDSAFA